MEYAVERYLTIGLALAFLYSRSKKSTRYIYREDFDEGEEEHLLPEGRAIRITFEYINEDGIDADYKGLYLGNPEAVEDYRKG